MSTGIAVITIVFLILLIAIPTWNKWQVSKVIAIMRQSHQDKWEASGCPSFMGCPSDIKSSYWAFVWLLTKWVFSEPEWIKQEQKARRILRRVRLTNLVVAVFTLACVLLAYYLRKLG